MLWDIVSLENRDSRIDNGIVFHVRLYVLRSRINLRGFNWTELTIDIMLSIF